MESWIKKLTERELKIKDFESEAVRVTEAIGA